MHLFSFDKSRAPIPVFLDDTRSVHAICKLISDLMKDHVEFQEEAEGEGEEVAEDEGEEEEE